MRRGFTLLEVIVALTISGLIVALVTVVWTKLTATSRALGRFQEHLDRRMNGERWLVEALTSAEPADPGFATFSGASLLRWRCGGSWSVLASVSVLFRSRFLHSGPL